ncbi:juvenile hormone acid O-methyltransferase-like isoform X2 [Haemaphysalis longicornis]
MTYWCGILQGPRLFPHWASPTLSQSMQKETGMMQANRTIYISKYQADETKERVEMFSRAIEPLTRNVAATLQRFKGALLPHYEALQDGKQKHGRRQCLDVGCGPGSFTVKHLLPCLPAWCETVVAVDCREETLRFARKNNAHSNIQYMNVGIESDEDVARFVAENGVFLLVTSFGMLHWVKDQQHAVRNIAKLVAADGECFIVFGRSLVIFDVCRALKQSPRWQKYSAALEGFIPPTHDMNFLDSRSYAESLVQGANLNVLACEVFDMPVDVTLTTEELADFYTEGNPFNRMISEEEKLDLQKFTYDFINELVKNSDKRIKRQQMLVIHACRSQK